MKGKGANLTNNEQILLYYMMALIDFHSLLANKDEEDILCAISKVTFEIAHKISYPYIERCEFYSQVNFKSF